VKVRKQLLYRDCWQNFDHMWKNGSNVVKVWDNIDQSKSKDGVAEFIKALHFSKYESQKKVMMEISTVEQTPCKNIPLNGNSPSDFPSLVQYGVPLEKCYIHSVLSDIYSLNQVVDGMDLLPFPLYNEVTCSLLRIPSSTDYDHVKRWITGCFFLMLQEKSKLKKVVLHGCYSILVRHTMILLLQVLASLVHC